MKNISLSAVGPLLFVALIGVFMVPFQTSALMDDLKLSAGLSGVFGTAELAAMSLTSILLVPAMRRIALNRLALIGVVLAIAGEVATAGASNLWFLGVARVTTGIGSGAVLAATSTSVAIAPNPDRIMGFGLTLTNFLFFLYFLIAPKVLSEFGFRGLFVMLGASIAAAGVASRWIPQSRTVAGDRTAQPDDPRATLNRARAAILMIGIAVLNIGLGAVWSFAERIGGQIGLHPAQIGNVLAMCPIAMIAGSATAGLVGDRFGHFWPLVTGSVACGTACYLTAASTGLVGFAAGLFGYNLFYLMLSPFAIAGVPAALDASGRLAAAAGGVMWLAFSVGITAGGFIADTANVRAIGMVAFGECILAAGAFAYVARPRADGRRPKLLGSS